MIGKYMPSEYDFSGFSESTLAAYYLNITKLPCLIHSPLREDNHPSFSLYTRNNKVYYLDFATGEKGTIWYLIKQLLGVSWYYLYRIIYETFIAKNKDIPDANFIKQTNKIQSVKLRNSVDIQVATRSWEDHDIQYWSSYGVPLSYLKMADVYPVDYEIITVDEDKIIKKAPQYCYAFYEFKEGKITLKVYRPFDVQFKWFSAHDKSILSLWTKVPKQGNNICICSSLKDALCLWANIGIPSIAVQGEGYSISDTAIGELKRRFKNVFICFDCDEPGLRLGKHLSEQTGFINVVLKHWDNCKDISDYYKYCNEERKDLTIFKENIINVFKEAIYGKKRSV